MMVFVFSVPSFAKGGAKKVEQKVVEADKKVKNWEKDTEKGKIISGGVKAARAAENPEGAVKREVRKEEVKEGVKETKKIVHH